jgi:hypothetical protein
MAKNLTFQPLHFNKKVNIVNRIYSKLTITIHSLLFKQFYFLSPPFSFFFFSLLFSTIAVTALCVFFLPSQLSSLLLKNAKNVGEHHCTTALHDARKANRRASLTFFSAGDHRWTT